MALPAFLQQQQQQQQQAPLLPHEADDQGQQEQRAHSRSRSKGASSSKMVRPGGGRSRSGSRGRARGAASHVGLQDGARSPLALGIVAATSLYCCAKAGIQGYQQLRRRNLRHLVRKVPPVLDALGVAYWADFGTLLGMYREKDIILHDNDADIVLLNPDWDALLTALKAALPGFRVFFVVPSEDASIRWIRVMSGVGIMDLYGGFAPPELVAACGASSSGALRLAAGKAGSSSTSSSSMVSIPQGHGDLCDVPARLVFPLTRLRFRGVPVAVPADVPGVLRFRYGEGFMVPRYMDKGRDAVEQGKLYARLLGALGKAGLRV